MYLECAHRVMRQLVSGEPINLSEPARCWSCGTPLKADGTCPRSRKILPMPNRPTDERKTE